ncbi:N,N-dimethylformamidase beta subunit family domain-containing protein [Pelagibius sp. Alg239-R121]|uniref:N,N-dimethylformamidase beta subunit family domain-containing protein n=1 Tax=Pelagibius sp. Alg239-R121 TaxID=2993448 RepID=UPI0024A74513|nr:N,N-dimethylformamidase beta subunit family domain-containing protein [Pelagibius sp. Alg239-R121]
MTSATDLIGYCQPLTLRGGEATELKISSNGPQHCDVTVYRIICGDIDPNGPGEAFERMGWGGAVRLPVTFQPVNSGSFGYAAKGPDAGSATGLRLTLSVFPTLIERSCQCLFHWGPLRLDLLQGGILTARLGETVIALSSPMLERHWYRIEVNAGAQILSISAELVTQIASVPRQEIKSCALPCADLARTDDPVLIAAALDRADGKRLFTTDAFNGKIETPTLFAMRPDKDQADDLLAVWDFSLDQSGTQATDTGPQGCHLTLINTPMRGASGSNWDSSAESWQIAPDQYAAIHFHEDDMTDCRWETSLTIHPPHDARPGFYIARLQDEGVQSDVPFFLSVRPGRAKAELLLIAPTATYLSYANTHIKFDSHNTENLYEAPMTLSEDELYLNEHRDLGLSHYDTHADDSGVIYVGERRPLLNTRPGLYTFNYLNDTHIVKWLETKGFAYDVATDEDLHRYGGDLLDNYRVVMTASHPEYYSTEMWDALFAYQQSGGRHMYLGGNGFYWRVAYSEAHPGVIENRRGMSGVRTWEGEPGEHHLSFTGEPGGLWRSHGRAPQRLVGTGFSSTFFVRSTYFRRSEASRDVAYDFVFEGLNSDIIGDFGFRGGGCVGLEIDRWDAGLGSPPGSVILATSEHVGQGGLLTGEEYITTTRGLDGAQNGRVRGDMVFFITPGGGAVWSTGSIAWATSLMWDGGKNSVSRVTENILKRFFDPEPFPVAASDGDARASVSS